MCLPALTRFIKTATEELAGVPVWALFPCIRVLEKNGLEYAYQNYIPEKLLSHLNVQDIRFIAGKLLQSKITDEDKITLSERYDGEQLAKISGDYRNWDDIDAWIQAVAKKIIDFRVMS